jgi:hypothetical protein
MKKSSKRIPLNHFLLSVITIGIFSSCSSDSASNSNSTTGFGEVITIPGITEVSGITGLPPAGDFVKNLKTSNEGIYMQVSLASTTNDWVYRLHGFGLPTWTKHELPSGGYQDWEISNPNSEWTDHFGIFFRTTNKNGLVSINTGLPALLEQNNPSFSVNEMLVDNSSMANKWAFSGNTVRIKQNNSSGLYNTICTLPSAPILFAEADPTDAVVWAAGQTSTLYKITVNGDVTPFDVSSYNDPSFIFNNEIRKIRFPYDVSRKDVYFNYQNKVFKITDGNTLSLFYTFSLSDPNNVGGGDFCVDNTFMYGTDGIKKHLQFLNETNIIPPMPDSTNQQVILDYISNVSMFNNGKIEVLKNSMDNYIYTIYSTYKLLRVPKSL